MTSWGGMVRRSSGDVVRKEDEPVFDYKLGKHGKHLDVKTRCLLSEIDEFCGFTPFVPGDIHHQLTVVLDDNCQRETTVSLSELKESLCSLKRELERLIKKKNRQEEIGKLKEKIQNLERIIDECEALGKESYSFTTDLLGYYTRHGESGREIHLMMDALGGKKMLTAIVYVHELMHAWYDLHEEEHSYCQEIEEPLAEFGMLSFLEMFQRVHAYDEYKDLLTNAVAHVRAKSDSLGICHYGYGYYLYEDKSNFCVNWVQLFHSSCMTMDIDSDDMKSYKSMISAIRYPLYERACEETLFAVIKPKRFYFRTNANFNVATSGCGYDRIFIYPVLNVRDSQFFARMAKPNPARLTFMDKMGNSINGDASVLDGSAGPRIYVKAKLLKQYVSLFGPVTKQFEFYEAKPADGTNVSEWLAREL